MGSIPRDSDLLGLWPGYRDFFFFIGIFKCVQGGFPGGSSGKESAHQCRRGRRHMFDSLGWEDSPGVGNGKSLQCSSLENPMDRGS